MKTVSTLALLALSADAAIIKRQHDHSAMGGMEGMSSMGSMGSPGNLGGLDIQSIIKSLGGKGGKGGKGGLAGMLRPEVRKAYKIEKLKPLVRPDATRVRITYGPYKIRASGVGLFLLVLKALTKVEQG
jgi:hypothetical protein